MKYSQQNQQTLEEAASASLIGFCTSSTVRLLSFPLAKGRSLSSQLSQLQLKYPPHSSPLNRGLYLLHDFCCSGFELNQLLLGLRLEAPTGTEHSGAWHKPLIKSIRSSSLQPLVLRWTSLHPKGCRRNISPSSSYT